MKKIKIYYDGFCPFCASYVKLQRIRKNYEVELHDLRGESKKTKEFTSQGYNLNEGMLIETDEGIYAGSDAVYLMSILQNNSLLGILWRSIFFNKTFTSLLYPVLVFFRNSTLIILRRPKIK